MSKRFTYQEEERIVEIGCATIKQREPAARDPVGYSIVWRRDPHFVLLVWWNREISKEEYVQHTYHVVFQIIYKYGQRYLRSIYMHESGMNTWTGPFRCRSCLCHIPH